MATYSDDLFDMYGCVNEDDTELSATSDELHESRVDEELQRWISCNERLATTASKTLETPINFWRRQAKASNFKFLPDVARIIFSVPTSSAQIERDFGKAGMMVTGQRSSLKPHNVEMSNFINCNRSFVDLTQCDKIPADEVKAKIPSYMEVGVNIQDSIEEFDADFQSVTTYFSAASFDDAE